MNFISELLVTVAIPTIQLTFLLLLIVVFSYFVVYKKVCKGGKNLQYNKLYYLY